MTFANNQRRALVLGSYPCVTPVHGGQIRLAEIINAYRQAGYAVQSINLYEMQPQPRGDHDFDFPPDTPWRLWHEKHVPLIADLNSGRYAAGDPVAYKKISAAVQGNPNIIHLEQPWLLPLVERWREEGKYRNARIVYGSQNIEAPLKKAILDRYHVAEAAAVADEIEILERRACEIADIVLAVSADDSAQLAAWSGKEVVLAANGIAAWQAESSTLQAWKKRLPQTPFALFVGSAHPPNISGFFDTLGDSLGFLPPDRKICIVGSVSPHIPAHPLFQRWGPLNSSRVQILGLVDNAALAAIKELAHAIILPITEGGGSNIKTAEALYSGKYVLGTPASFRGFDRYRTLSGVKAAQTPAVFKQAMCTMLHQPPHQSSPQASQSEHVLRQTLLWTETLKPMLKAVNSHNSHSSQ